MDSVNWIRSHLPTLVSPPLTATTEAGTKSKVRTRTVSHQSVSQSLGGASCRSRQSQEGRERRREGERGREGGGEREGRRREGERKEGKKCVSCCRRQAKGKETASAAAAAPMPSPPSVLALAPPPLPA